MQNPAEPTPANETDPKSKPPKVGSTGSDADSSSDENEGELGCDDHPDIAKSYLPPTETEHWFWKHTRFNAPTQAERDAHLKEFRKKQIKERAEGEAASTPPSTVSIPESSASSSDSSATPASSQVYPIISAPTPVTFSAPVLTQGDFPPPVTSLAGVAQPELSPKKVSIG